MSEDSMHGDRDHQSEEPEAAAPSDRQPAGAETATADGAREGGTALHPDETSHGGAAPEATEEERVGESDDDESTAGSDADGEPASSDRFPRDDDPRDEDEDRASPQVGNGSGTSGVAARHEAASHDEHHGIAHVVPLPMLATIFGALVVLTILTVAVTTIDFGSSTNLVVAMVIATIKASLVIAVFMHLWYDRSINLLLFLTSILFVVLFISLSMIDRSEYQPSIDQLQATQEAAAAEG